MKKNKESVWMLNNEQQLELESQGYTPSVRHLNLYADDFRDSKTWDEVCQCVDMQGEKMMVLAIIGTKNEL